MRWHWIMLTTAATGLAALTGCSENEQQLAQGPPAPSQPEPMTFETGPTGSGSDGATEPQNGATEPQNAAASSSPPGKPTDASGDSAAGSAGTGGSSAPQRMDMPPASGQQRNYTIQEGDTLYSLAERFYGNGQKWQLIDDANPEISPRKLPVGKQIVVPAE